MVPAMQLDHGFAAVGTGFERHFAGTPASCLSRVIRYTFAMSKMSSLVPPIATETPHRD